MKKFHDRSIEDRINIIRSQDEDIEVRLSARNIITRLLVVFPVIVFTISFFVINRDLNIYNILSKILFIMLLICLGVLLNFLYQKLS